MTTIDMPNAIFPAQDRNFSEIHRPVLKVIGLGGGGCNAVNRMIELGLEGVEFVAANTDHQALRNCLAPVKIQLGPRETRGLGAGGKPEVGRAAAEESYKAIAAALTGADMVFLTAGMGGGTGTGSIPVAAQVARDLKAVAIAIVTTPFSFEMGRRQKNAREGLACLRSHTDTLISIPNDRLLYVAPRNLPMEVAFRLADDVLRQAVQGITELITETGMINVDFSHVYRLMKLGGGSLMSIGQGQGENKAMKAIEQALYHPLLETASLESAAGILVNFTGGKELSLFEIEAALTFLKEQAGPQAEIVLGVTHDDRLDDRVQVILVVTGLGATSLEEALFNVRRPERTAEAVQEISTESPAEEAASRRASQPVPARLTLESHGEPIEPDPLPAVHSAAATNLDLPAFLRRRM